MSDPSKLLGGAPSFTSAVRSQTSAASGGIGDFTSGSFNIGGSSLSTLAMIAGGIFLLIKLLDKKGRK